MSTVTVVCPACHKINRIPVKESYTKANCGHCKNSLLDAKPVEATAQNFSQFVGGSGLPVVVDFWAPWCGPCKMMAPQFQQDARLLEPKVRLAKVDTEAEPQLATRFGIRSIPTLALFRGGREIARQAGAMGAKDIVRWASSAVVS